MRPKHLLIVLVAGVATVVAFAAGNAIGSSGRLAGPPVTYNAAGDPFIRSPNGQYSITVGNAGIVLSGPAGGRVILSSTALRATVSTFDLRAATTGSVEASQFLGLRAGTSLGLTAGANVQLNGCAQPVVRGTDSVTVTGSTGKITPGQTAVCMG
jgi:hypothetical protein